jgi:hypothetical protein
VAVVVTLLQALGEGVALPEAQVEAEAEAQALGVPLLHCVTVELPEVVPLALTHTLAVGDSVGQLLGLWLPVPLVLRVALRV